MLWAADVPLKFLFQYEKLKSELMHSCLVYSNPYSKIHNAFEIVMRLINLHIHENANNISFDTYIHTNTLWQVNIVENIFAPVFLFVQFFNMLFQFSPVFHIVFKLNTQHTHIPFICNVAHLHDLSKREIEKLLSIENLFPYMFLPFLYVQNGHHIILICMFSVPRKMFWINRLS